MSTKKRLLNILFWSVISAAFIGPGTVTTAASSGASYGTSLLWALLFSTLACLLLQEAASRLSILTGRNLGQSIHNYFANTALRNPVLIFVPGTILLGTAAYETGNLLGSAEGVRLLFSIPSYIPVLVTGVLAATLLFVPSLRIVPTVLGIVVVAMGAAFLFTAIMVNPGTSEIFKGAFVPSFPGPHAGTLVLALIGTTIVPYNLFLGSGLSKKGESVKDMRFGLVTAILLGGVFSMAVLVTGSAIAGEFSFPELASVLEAKIGSSGKYLLGFGLFAAGFTSAVTAPLAAAVTLSSVLGHGNPEKWRPGSIYYRLTWMFVLGTGIGFALLNIRTVPAIILAQALNGFLLPFVSIFLYMVIQKNVYQKSIKAIIANILMLAVIFITLLIGLNSASRAAAGIFQASFHEGLIFRIVVIALSVLIVIIVALPSRRDMPPNK